MQGRVKTRMGQEAKVEYKKWSRTFVFNTGKARQGRGDGLGLAILNTIGRLGEGVPICLVLGPGMISTEYCLLKWESQEEGGGSH